MSKSMRNTVVGLSEMLCMILNKIRSLYDRGNFFLKKIKGRNKHNGVVVIGPKNSLNELIPYNITPWMGGNRPRITFPYNRLIIDNKNASFSITMEKPERGEYILILRSGFKKMSQFYKFNLGEKSILNLKDLGIKIPVGTATAWAGFLPYGEKKIKYSSPMYYFVKNKKDVSNHLHYAILPDKHDYRALSNKFCDNLSKLDFADNIRLKKQEIEEGRTILLSSPLQIQLLLGRRCNANCIMCGDGRQTDLTSVPIAITRQLPELYHLLKSMTVVGGEPLLFHETKDIIDQAKNFRQMSITLATNGSLLMNGWMDIILNGRFQLKISVDAVNKDTYEKIRRKLSWDRLIKNFEHIREHRKGVFPKITFCFTTMRSNYKQIVDFVNFAHSFGATTLYYNLMVPQLALEPENFHENLHNDQAACGEIVGLIHEAKERSKELGMVMIDKVLGWIFVKYPQFIENEDELSILPFPQREEAIKQINENTAQHKTEASHSQKDYLSNHLFCTIPFQSLHINQEYSSPCCHSRAPFPRMTYGHVQGIFDAWNHPLNQVARKMLFLGKGGTIVCHPKCPHYRHGGMKFLYSDSNYRAAPPLAVN